MSDLPDAVMHLTTDMACELAWNAHLRSMESQSRYRLNDLTERLSLLKNPEYMSALDELERKRKVIADALRLDGAS